MRIVPARLLKLAIARHLRRLATQDAYAYSRGWTVHSGRFGSRAYRDPRWDYVEELRAAHLRDKLATAVNVSATHRRAVPHAPRAAAMMTNPTAIR